MPVFNSSGRAASGAIGFGHGGHGGRRSFSWPWGYPWLGGYPYGFPTIGIQAYPYTSFPSNPTARWYLDAMGISCAVWNGLQDIALKRAMVKKLFATYGMTLSEDSPTDAVRIQQVIDAASACAAIQPSVVPPYYGGYGGWLGGPGLIRPWGVPLTPFGLGGTKIVASGEIGSGAVTPLVAWIGGAIVGGGVTYLAVKKMSRKKA
jgi:hypothetical protein